MRSLALGLALALAVAGCAPSAPPATAVAPAALAVEAEAADWKPIAVADMQAVMPAPPPAAGSAEAMADAETLKQRMAAADPQAIARWNAGSPVLTWSKLVREENERQRLDTFLRDARSMAVVQVAVYDALLATWRAKRQYQRPGPAGAGMPSYPSEHAAIAYATAHAMAYAYPAGAESFMRLADEAAAARLGAGLNYPSDVEAGRAIGEKVAAAVIARAKADGAEAPDPYMNTPFPKTGDGWWDAAPAEALAGTWKPWVLERGDQFDIAKPPALTDASYKTQLDELVDMAKSRTPEQQRAIEVWAYDSGSLRWVTVAANRAEKHGWSDMRSARLLAYTSAICADAFINCWSCKYAHAVPRPNAMAERLEVPFKTYITTPRHPSYPSGHSTVSSAAAHYLSAVFPEEREAFMGYLSEASLSRLWAGIHYRMDKQAGEALGQEIAAYYLTKGREEGVGF